MRYVISPGGELRGELRVASDKSISHRAVLLAALADGKSEISNVLMGEDVRATIAAVQACGVEVNEDGKRLIVKGKGGLASPVGDIDCGNSGTLMRLFCGVAAGWNVNTRLVGDSSLMKRPMRRITEPLECMGADITDKNGCPPVQITAGKRLFGMSHKLPVASAQIKSALLLAGLRAEGETAVIEPFASRDHTERMLQMFGVPVRREGLCCAVSGKAVLSPTRIKIPADPSSAAFFMVGSVIAPNSDLLLKEVCVNPTRNGVIELLRRMGAHIEMLNPRKMGSEPVADIRVVGGSLRGIDIVGAEVPAAIDDLPALFVAAATAHGKTRLTGASELRHKESDRIAAMADGLQRLGVGCETTEDGIVIEGRGDKKSVFSGGEVDSCGDHRIAMAFTMAALRAKDSVVVNDCDNVSTSFPGFGKMATAAGIRIAVSKD